MGEHGENLFFITPAIPGDSHLYCKGSIFINYQSGRRRLEENDPASLGYFGRCLLVGIEKKCFNGERVWFFFFDNCPERSANCVQPIGVLFAFLCGEALGV